jgi:L-ascorbate metabolism protein UlaG (beta-lactamase superfamily)
MSSSEQAEAPGDRRSLGITWLGHSTVRIEIDGMSVLTDPVLVNDIVFVHRYARAPEAAAWAGVDIVLISHCHQDHLDLRSLRMLGAKTRIVAPAGAASIVRKAGLDQVTELAAGESIAFGPLSIRAIPALHSGFRPPFGPRAEAIGYVVRGSRSVHFAGDTGLHPEMSELAGEGIDVSLLPVWGWGPRLRGGHLDPAGAVEALRMIRPRMAIPVHWGTFWPRGLRWFRRDRFERPGWEFAELAGASGVEVEVVVLRAGGALRAQNQEPRT